MRALMVGALLVAGCRGGAALHLVPTDTKRISTGDPLVIHVTPDECYHWLGEGGELCVAMRLRRPSLLGKLFAREFVLSLAVDGPPAGSARSYPVNRDTLRLCDDAGFAHTRAGSMGGIMAVWDYDKSQIRGRMRIPIKQQTYSVLTGWSGDARVLLVGDFTAIRDEKRGGKILSRTEERGMERSKERTREIPLTAPANSSPAPKGP